MRYWNYADAESSLPYTPADTVLMTVDVALRSSNPERQICVQADRKIGDQSEPLKQLSQKSIQGFDLSTAPSRRLMGMA